jgi:N-acyl-D-aspartate/D-glutamate deacylase
VNRVFRGELLVRFLLRVILTGATERDLRGLTYDRGVTTELVIRGGNVVDGTGAPPRTADVAINNGVVVDVGRVADRGAREIDADGALVAPGFVDVHTHYDGQATWDDTMQPSSFHGVTTVVAGNCGVGFAPVRVPDRERLVELMEGVEDLPGTVLHEGLTWEWESIGDFLDALDARSFDVDVATQVCHGPLRLYVMGERGAQREPASAEEIDAMGRIAAEGIAAGALGFSTSRTLNHRTSRGEPTPTLTAAREELVGIARAIGATGAGVLQVVSDFPDFTNESETFLEMMRASGRPLSFSLAQGAPGGAYKRQLALLDRANDEGLTMRGQVAPRPVGVLVGLQGSVNPLRRLDAYRRVAALPVPEQARALAAPDARAALVAELEAAGVRLPLDRIYELGDPPNYEPAPESSIAARAARAGRSEADLVVELLLAHDGANFLYLPFLNYFDGDLDAVGEMLAHEHTIPGLGDGGAHVGTICDASFPTTLLTHWCRDREKGARFDVAWAVHQQARATAEALGLRDRGVLAPGYKADVNVIDFENLRVMPPRVTADLPAGGRRFSQGAHGYVHTFVSGIETYRDGAHTGALPGRLVRHAREEQSA